MQNAIRVFATSSYCLAVGLCATLILTLGSVTSASETAITLSDALDKFANKSECQITVTLTEPAGTVTALHIASGTKCAAVTVGSSDDGATSVQNPLPPVVIGSGGSLTFKDEPATVFAQSFLIRDTGQMLAGRLSAPVSSRITIVMTGDKSASPAPMATGNSPIVTTTNATPNARDITVMAGGVLALYGSAGLSAAPNGTDNDPATNPAFINIQEGTESWTYLSLPAGPAGYDDAQNVSSPVPSSDPATTLTLARVVGWTAGDWISVATTSFSSHQTEIVQIDAAAQVNDPHATAAAITGATSAKPIVVTTAQAPATGSTVAISGVTGNAAANGTWTVTRVSDTTFSLDGSDGTRAGAYNSGGSWIPRVSQLTLAQPLKHYHFGGQAPTPGYYPADTQAVVADGGAEIDVSHQAKSYYDKSDRNFGIDERAEVALLSRSIKLTSTAGAQGDARKFIGGHIAAMKGAHHGAADPQVTLVGVEIEKFGQDRVGRYPVHLHHLSAATGSVLVQDVSVHHSYNKCFVVHGSANAKFYNNVCVRTVGQGVYLEDGANITGNAFIRNHIAGTMAAGSTYTYPLPADSQYWDGDTLQSAQGMISGVAKTAAGEFEITATVAPATGTEVTVAGVKGATGANGAWTARRLTATTFSLEGSTASGTYTSGGAWSTGDDWYTISGISDTSLSGCNSEKNPDTCNFGGFADPGPDTYHPGGFWITNLGNTFVNNSVAGCQAEGRGYWLISQDVGSIGAYPEFTGNRAHACYNGIDTAPDAINNASNPYPLLAAPSNPITGATNPGPLVTSTTAAFPDNLGSITPTVTFYAKGGAALPGSYSVKAISGKPDRFSVTGALPAGADKPGVTWTLGAFPVYTVTQQSGSDVVITVPPGIPVPPNGSTVALTGLTDALDTSWSVKQLSTTTFSLDSSSSVTDLTCETPPTQGHPCNGMWGMHGPVSSIETSPIVITTTGTAPATGTIVNISDVKGNTAANGTWTIKKLSSTTFSLDGSAGNAPYTANSGTWRLADYPAVLVLNANTVTRSRNRGFWGRSLFFALHDNRFAANLYGVSLAGGGGPEGNLPGFWALAHRNVFAAMTRNNVDRYPPCENTGEAWKQECTDVTLGASGHWGNYPDPEMNIQGYSYYDGPARIEDNRFVNFRFDPTGIYPDAADRDARLLTVKDIKKIKKYGSSGQLEGVVTSAPSGSNAVPSSIFEGYAGDPATGWIQSNAQSVPPTQYIQNSIWDNVDFKHQVYDESVNMGIFEDGDKTTVILDLDSRLSGLKVVCKNGNTGTACNAPPAVSLNNLPYYATDYSVDEPHSRGPNNFLETSLMSPHKFATLNIEGVDNPLDLRVEVFRDMPAYGDTDYPSLFLNGRGQNPIFEPFVMDRMGYTVRAMDGTENEPGTQSPQAFQNRLLFSYTDPYVKQAGEFFINRIAVYQPVGDPSKIKMYRVRRQWGQQYKDAAWPPAPYVPPVAEPSCDGTFFPLAASQQATAWSDCVSRAGSSGRTLSSAESWSDFSAQYTTLLSNPTAAKIKTFVDNQTYFYDTANQLLYFYMIEDKPVQQQYAPMGTCDAVNYTGGRDFVGSIQDIKTFSNTDSVRDALDTACFASNGVPTKSQMFTCSAEGCAAYLVDLTEAQAPTGAIQTVTAVTGGGSSTPITISSASVPATGDRVTVSGVDGFSGANGTWTVTKLTDTSFSLNGSKSKGSGAYTSGGAWFCASCTPAHPITRAAFANDNPFEFAYATPTQQANGLPVTANAAAGNTPPPTDGTALGAVKTPTADAPPPGGNRVAFNFLPLSDGAFEVTSDFPYHCTTTPPWSPVNARGAYPPADSFTYPLHASVCTVATITDVTGASATSPIVVTSTTAAPPTGTKVTISGVEGYTGVNKTWTITWTSHSSFALNNSELGTGSYSAGTGTWQVE